ncbi:MAG: dTDP-4-dehydrorhamnose reductase [Ramlibacter sp.]
MKILLFGRNGQVGWELQRSLAPLGEVIAVDRATVGLCGDLVDLDGIRRTVREVKPDAVVNAAAYTAVDRAESEPELCRRINALAPEAMAEAAKGIGAWMLHYSTDYVFDGSGDRAWTETDVVAPISIYGATKAEGELRIAAACADHMLLRTSWVYAARGANFIHTMLRLGQERERLTVVADQHGAPTGAELIADVTAHALQAAVRGDGLAGTYHLAPSGETTWYDYAQHIMASARAAGLPIKAALEPVPSSAYPTAARRPHNSRLDNRKLQAAFGLQLPPWQPGVERVLAGVAGAARSSPDRQYRP